MIAIARQRQGSDGVKRILAAIGMLAIGVVILGVAAIAFAFYEGDKLDREATAYSMDAVVAITGRWDIEALRTRAAPPLASAMAKEQGARVFAWLATLGPLQDRPECQGSATVYAGTGRASTGNGGLGNAGTGTPGTGNASAGNASAGNASAGGSRTTADMTCTAHYRAGPATILLALIRKGGVWFIAGFHVTSPELLPQFPTQKA
jgi:hypothetical protein